MNEWVGHFFLAWIPLFIAMDPVGLVPLFIGITQGVEPTRLQRIVRQATITAAGVSIGFMFLGRLIFEALGITVADFQIAGGLILFALSARDLLSPPEIPTVAREDIGVVPLGMPLIAGPATITTLLLLLDLVGTTYTLMALVTNLFLIHLSFKYGRRLTAWIGLNGLRAFAKITSMLLAAIAVYMIRQGIQSFVDK